MRHRKLGAATALLLVVSACTGGDADRENVTEPVDGDPISLTYRFEAGDEFLYDVALSQSLSLATSGDATAVAEGDLPGSAQVTIDASGPFTYSVSDGPSEGTFAIAIDGEFTDVSVEGTVDGEPVEDPEQLAGLSTVAPVAPVSTTVLVDGRGRVVGDTTSTTDPLGLGASPLTGLAGDLSRFVGPPLPAEEVVEGQTWTETSRSPSPLSDEPIETTVAAAVSGSDTLDGRDVLVIESTSETGPIRVDLSEFIAGFLGAFEEGGGDPPAGDLQFEIEVDPTTTQAVTSFDPASGTVVRSTVAGPTGLSMTVVLPGDDGGELERYEVRLEVDQEVSYHLR